MSDGLKYYEDLVVGAKANPDDSRAAGTEGGVDRARRGLRQRGEYHVGYRRMIIATAVCDTATRDQSQAQHSQAIHTDKLARPGLPNYIRYSRR